MSNINKREIHNQQLKAFITGFLSDPAHDNQSSRSLTAEVFRIALASLEAEAVGEVVLGEYDDCGCHPDARVACIAADGQADWENFKDGTRLYTAPLAPVYVPDEMTMQKALSAIDQLSWQECTRDAYMLGWNACRAAMLQGADGNSPVIPDGWVLVPEEPTHEMLEAGDEQFGTYDVYRRMIAASPQQEVNP